MDRLTWAEISLRNFADNFLAIKKAVGPARKIMGVVKADAYGHGLARIGQELQKLGGDYLGVACLAEAKNLRKADVRLPILVLGYTDPLDFGRALDLMTAVNIMDERSLQELDKLARIRGKMATVHIKIDTGMHRLGASPELAIKLIKNIYKYKNIYLEGIFSHFADLKFAKEQLEEFKKMGPHFAPSTSPGTGRCVASFRALRGKDLIRHIANSDAVFGLPESHLDMVRPGKALYKNVLSLKTQIVGIRRLKKGETVGYGREFMAQKNILVGAIPVGYADGFRRSPKNWGKVVVNGRKVPVLGRVSMDQASIMISKKEKIGDEVILIGEGMPVEKVAKTLETIPLEVWTGISGRVERVYNK